MDIGSTLRHGLNNLLNFSGRESREQFRIYFLIAFFGPMLIAALFFLEDALNGIENLKRASYLVQHDWEDYFEFRDRRAAIEKPAYFAFAKVAAVGLVLPILLTASSMARRVHDIGYSEKWLVAALLVSLAIPFMPLVVIVVLCLVGSETADNKYGSPPKCKSGIDHGKI